MKHMLSTVVLAGVLAWSASGVLAQAPRNYRARLSPVPIDVSQVATITGSGSVTAVLNGTKLTVTGTFEGMKSPATVVHLHMGQRGVRGPSVLDLQATKATSGTISGAIDLTSQQLQDLQNSRLYVQLHSEKAPDGNLWGWLLPQEIKK